MFVIMSAKSLFVLLLLRILAVGISFGPSVNASAVLIATRPILNSLATIPTGCNNTCNAIQVTLSDCTTAQCVCTSSNEASLNTCVNCLDAVEPNNQTNIAQGQNILEQFTSVCDAGGVSVPLETASGFTGSVGLISSAAPSGSSGTTSAGSSGATSVGSSGAASGGASTGTLSEDAASSSTFAQTSGTSVSVSQSPSLSSAASSGASTSTANSTASTVSSSSASSTTAASSGAKRMFGESTTIASGGSLLFGMVLLWI